MREAELGQPTGERLAGELRAVVGQHPGQFGADRFQGGADLGQEPGCDAGGLVADDEPDHGPAGRDVDRGELPDRADALELADVEGVQAALLTWVDGRKTRTGRPG